MTTSTKLVPAMLLASAVLIAGCQKKTDVAPAAVVTEAPAAAAPAQEPAPVAAAPAAASAFDINSVPITTAALPPFPYLDWPLKLAEDERHQDDELDFDATNVVVGSEIRSIEGRVQRRHYLLSDAKLSPLAVERNYDSALKAMGFVQVNKLQPGEDDFKAAFPAHDDLSNVRDSFKIVDYGKHKTYLARTPKGNVWVILTVDEQVANIVTIEEKAMQQSIKPLSAAQMQSALAANGHVALYMNFDTDKAVILDQDQGTIEEVGRLLAGDGALKLRVEGHTDTSGDAKRNQVLSEQRANAVVASLVSRGIDRTRLAALGVGGSKPVADNGSEEGRAKNRRVELVKQG